MVGGPEPVGDGRAITHWKQGATERSGRVFDVTDKFLPRLVRTSPSKAGECRAPASGLLLQVASCLMELYAQAAAYDLQFFRGDRIHQSRLTQLVSAAPGREGNRPS